VSRRFNKYGFSLRQMRRLLGSRDEAALQQLKSEIALRNHFLKTEEQKAILDVVARAVMSGVPFPELQAESWIHAVAALSLGLHGQEVLMNYSSVLEDAYALEDGLWGCYRKFASAETRAFLHGLVEGIPMFGCKPPGDGSAYGAISLDRLRVFEPGFRDLAEIISYRVGRSKAATELDQNVVEFATELSAWLNQLIAAERDLFFSFGGRTGQAKVIFASSCLYLALGLGSMVSSTCGNCRS
jgi:hypothetical protein